MSVAGQVTTRSVRWRGDAGWNQTYRLQVGLDWCAGALQAREAPSALHREGLD